MYDIDSVVDKQVKQPNFNKQQSEATNFQSIPNPDPLALC
jgi:hypothetical protein